MRNFSAESNEEHLDDEEDDILPSPSTGPTAPSPTHECNVSVRTPGVRRSIRLQANEKEAKNLSIQSIVIKPHYLSDIDPFDKLLDNHDHVDDILSNPEVISVIPHHLMAIADTAPKYSDDADDLLVDLCNLNQ
jgi:hypothetical protein